MSNPVHEAARDPGKVVLEGLHAVKHAIRFGAVLDGLWSDAPAEVLAQARALAPDIVPVLGERIVTVSSDAFRALAARPPATRLIGVAARPSHSTAATGDGPVVLLDRPRHPGNLGAVIRVAAAADAAAVWSLGGVDPWSAAAIELGGDADALFIMEPGAKHSVCIGTLADPAPVYEKLEEWLGIDLSSAKRKPPINRIPEPALPDIDILKSR